MGGALAVLYGMYMYSILATDLLLIWGSLRFDLITSASKPVP